MNARGERIHGCGMFWRNISCIFQRSSHVVNLDALSFFRSVQKVFLCKVMMKNKTIVMMLCCVVVLQSYILKVLSQLSMNINEN